MKKHFRSLKEGVKRRAPWVSPVYQYLRWKYLVLPRWRMMGMGVFTHHYQRNNWGCSESVSGEGSTLEQTAVIRGALPQLIKDFRIQSMLDIPCGDFNWMKLLDLPIHYIGADVVDEIVALNQRRFGKHARSFTKLDLTVDALPKVDLIFCRDCLFHFSYKHIFSALNNAKRSGSGYLLTTTNTQLKQNKNIVTGEFRRLNLQISPFSLPTPLLLINEKCPNPDKPDKSMGLWRISDL
jgi:hypothetical protein